MNDFYWSLFGETRMTPYPGEVIERVCVDIDFDWGATPDARTLGCRA